MTTTTTAAAAAALPPTFRMLPIAEIFESRHNPRKHFDQVALQELTASVREKGVLQPILVRPRDDGRHEIVCGARRYRAAKAADLADIPAVVRDLTDEQALESAVVENLQRSDVHPLEEAEGYEQLMKLHKHTADELGAKVGKSKAYVYARLKLLALSPEAREAFYKGDLNPSTALLVARIPGHQLQHKALKEITAKDYNGDVFSVRRAGDHIQRTYMLRLKEAPFSTKDAKLVPKAGACADCPKRTGNQPELFADVSGADVCTDPACFDTKREAHYAIARAEAKAKGQEVISGKAAKEIAPHGYVGRGYVSADSDSHWMGNANVDVAATIKKLPDVPVKLIEMPTTHELVPIVEEKVLAAAMKKAGLIKTAPRTAPTRAPQKTGPDKFEIEDQVRWRLLEAIRGRLTADPSTVSVADGALVASLLWTLLDEHGSEDGAERLAIAYGWIDPPDPKAKATHERYGNQRAKVVERFGAMSVQELWRVLIDLALTHHVDADYGIRTDSPEALYVAAKRHGVDAAKVRAEVLAAIKAKADEAKAAAKATKKEPAKPKATPPAKAAKKATK